MRLKVRFLVFLVAVLGSVCLASGFPDTDGGGVPDVSDNCPGVPNLGQTESEPVGSFGPQQVMSTEADFVRSVFAADLDGDLDLDVLAVTYFAVSWFENLGGSETKRWPGSVYKRCQQYL